MASINAGSDPVAFDPEDNYHASALHEAHQRLASVSADYMRRGKDPELKKMAQASATHSGEHVVKLAKWMAKRWANSSQHE